jgi:hypothetical protein
MEWATAPRLAVAIEHVAEDPAREPAPGRGESVSIAQARSAASMTDVIIVVIALTVALAVLPVLRARRRPKRNGDEQRQT